MRSRLFPRHAKTHFYALFALIHAFNILYKVCVKSRKDRRRNHVTKEEIPPRSVRGGGEHVQFLSSERDVRSLGSFKSN